MTRESIGLPFKISYKGLLLRHNLGECFFFLCLSAMITRNVATTNAAVTGQTGWISRVSAITAIEMGGTI